MQDYIHDTACLYERWASGDSSSFLLPWLAADSRIRGSAMTWGPKWGEIIFHREGNFPAVP